MASLFIGGSTCSSMVSPGNTNKDGCERAASETNALTNAKTSMLDGENLLGKRSTASSISDEGIPAVEFAGKQSKMFEQMWLRTPPKHSLCYSFLNHNQATATLDKSEAVRNNVLIFLIPSAVTPRQTCNTWQGLLPVSDRCDVLNMELVILGPEDWSNALFQQPKREGKRERRRERDREKTNKLYYDAKWPHNVLRSLPNHNGSISATLTYFQDV